MTSLLRPKGAKVTIVKRGNRAEIRGPERFRREQLAVHEREEHGNKKRAHAEAVSTRNRCRSQFDLLQREIRA